MTNVTSTITSIETRTTTDDVKVSPGPTTTIQSRTTINGYNGPVLPTLTRTVHFDSPELGKGVTAPTDVTIGTTPAVPALLFDRITETAVLYVSFVPDMDLTEDMTFEIEFALVVNQTNLDQLDITIDYVVPVANSTGQGPAKASSQVTGSLQVTTANGLAIGDLYRLSLTIASDDATNPLIGGAGICIEFHLTNVDEVGDIHLLEADLDYVALY